MEVPCWLRRGKRSRLIANASTLSIDCGEALHLSLRAPGGKLDHENFPVLNPHQWISRALLLMFAATALCTFLSACYGTAYRHEARVENRVDRRHARWSF